MREIKFRAWDRESAEIKTVDMLRLIGLKTYQQIGLIKDGIEDIRNIEQVDLMQFTGLLDKSGKEIYEGDIVKWGHLEGWSKENEVRIGEVKINPDIQFDVKNISSPHVFEYGNFAYKQTEKYLEIIGNLYENPELLK